MKLKIKEFFDIKNSYVIFELKYYKFLIYFWSSLLNKPVLCYNDRKVRDTDWWNIARDAISWVWM